MKAMFKVLAGCGVLTALGASAPASAQYFPGFGYPGYGYGPNRQMVVAECTRAVQARLGGYSGYGYGGGRVLGVTDVSPREDGGIAVRGIAATGYYGGASVSWRCRTDARGYIREIAVNPSDSRYRYSRGYDYDYSPYGYRRY